VTVEVVGARADRDVLLEEARTSTQKPAIEP
jgi:hypothetical protein